MQGSTFRRFALVAWIMQALIIVSGAAVRLTEAGLGCEDWPTCNDERVLPEWQLHGLIEFGNRLISGVVALSAVAVLIAAYRRRPRRPDLIGYAWAVVGGTVAQVVLGGITVLADLHPIVVSVHFLVSMGLLWAAQVLWFRAGPGRDADRIEARRDQLLVRLQLVLATVVLLSGTVVTGSGPNSGDARADRLGFDLETVARIHSFFVWCLVASVVVLAVTLARRRSLGPSPLAESAVAASTAPSGPGSATGTDRPPSGLGQEAGFTVERWLLVAVVAQGAVGYTQFALGVPPLLVELHIIGAVIVWSLAILLHLHHTETTPVERRLIETPGEHRHQPGRADPSVAENVADNGADNAAGTGSRTSQRNEPAGR
ncbi:MAG: COX15/CtaA family protein [Acidimicrobiales bacterium]